MDIFLFVDGTPHKSARGPDVARTDHWRGLAASSLRHCRKGRLAGGYPAFASMFLPDQIFPNLNACSYPQDSF